ncbi:MAG: hypothetical protein EXX96DRAFT_485984 [Benjaminiella poitrasii]|nr:MAG: hypothetical protein EXX96DRAFT_485984 [Benjaminiella poitrasii]
MSSQLNQTLVKFYEPLPQNDIILPETEWEKFVNEAPSRYGVKWIIKNEHTAVLTSDGRPLIKRGPQIDYIWYKTFICHRSGHKQIRKDIMIGGASGQKRPMQKRSKKDGCPAKIKIISYVNNPGSVSVIYMNTHNHNVGSTEEF